MALGFLDSREDLVWKHSGEAFIAHEREFFPLSRNRHDTSLPLKLGGALGGALENGCAWQRCMCHFTETFMQPQGISALHCDGGSCTARLTPPDGNPPDESTWNTALEGTWTFSGPHLRKKHKQTCRLILKQTYFDDAHRFGGIVITA